MGGLEPAEGKHFVRQWLDAQDREGTWYEAQVVQIAEGKLRVHFKGYPSEDDEWIPKGSSKIAALHTHTRPLFERDHLLGMDIKGDIRMGMALDVFDSADKWMSAYVIDVDGRYDMIKVHYDGWDAKYDEWLPIDSYRLARAGLHIVKKSGKMEASEYYREGVMEVEEPLTKYTRGRHKEALSISQSVEEKYRSSISRLRGMKVYDMEGDGNCLFRTISHQVYGNPRHHRIVRLKILEYVEAEASFFRQYVFDEDFSAYTRRLKQDGEWGGEVEVRAACEMYGRSVEIFHYSLEPKEVYHPPKPFILQDQTLVTTTVPSHISDTKTESKGSAVSTSTSHESTSTGHVSTSTEHVSTSRAAMEGKVQLSERSSSSSRDTKSTSAHVSKERKLKLRLESTPTTASTPSPSPHTPVRQNPVLSPPQNPATSSRNPEIAPSRNSGANNIPLPPIRLSYHWNSHYNSLVNPSHFPVLRSEPGEVETQGIASAKHRQRSAETEESRALKKALDLSRKEFENRDLNQFFKQALIGATEASNQEALEKALSMSLQEEESKFNSILVKTRKEEELREARELQIATKNSVNEDMTKAMTQSLQDEESMLLRKAMEESLLEQERKEMKLVVSRSKAESHSGSKKREREIDFKEETKLAEMFIDDDFAVQAAIEASMRQ
ncbi:hypothetical protein AAMO2058_001216900 [Amorphochlora amoebiformis]